MAQAGIETYTFVPSSCKWFSVKTFDANIAISERWPLIKRFGRTISAFEETENLLWAITQLSFPKIVNIIVYDPKSL